MQVITYKGYSFLRTQTPHVHPMSFSFHRQSATKPSFQQLDIVQLSSPALLSYLQERGINTALAKRECREAHFTNNDKRYFAIAFPNISGRYEIRNRYFNTVEAGQILPVILRYHILNNFHLPPRKCKALANLRSLH